ncbi:unnamed protein product, partial [Ectocarpus sp. 13 AM-2016]
HVHEYGGQPAFRLQETERQCLQEGLTVRIQLCLTVQRGCTRGRHLRRSTCRYVEYRGLEFRVSRQSGEYFHCYTISRSLCPGQVGVRLHGRGGGVACGIPARDQNELSPARKQLAPWASLSLPLELLLLCAWNLLKDGYMCAIDP